MIIYCICIFHHIYRRIFYEVFAEDVYDIGIRDVYVHGVMNWSWNHTWNYPMIHDGGDDDVGDTYYSSVRIGLGDVDTVGNNSGIYEDLADGAYIYPHTVSFYPGGNNIYLYISGYLAWAEAS